MSKHFLEDMVKTKRQRESREAPPWESPISPPSGDFDDLVETKTRDKSKPRSMLWGVAIVSIIFFVFEAPLCEWNESVGVAIS